MVIAINISFLKKEQALEFGPHVEAVCTQMTGLYPGHSFIFIVNEYFRLSITGSNIRVLEAGVGPRRTWRWKWWVAVRLPSLLKKNGVSVLLSAAGYGCSRAGIPEIMLLPFTDFLQEGSHYTKAQAAFFSGNMASSMQRVNHLLVFSAYTKSAIQERYSIAAEKISVVSVVPLPCFKVLPYQDRMQAKERVAGPTEYLLYNGAVHAGKNIMHLLRAFSVFKKRQKTNMKLVLIGDKASVWPWLTDSLQTYRYRDDIVFAEAGTAEERAVLTAAAYALVYPAVHEDIPVYATEALLCGVPVIGAAGSAAAEVAGDAGVYADTSDINDIAEKIMLLYKDENRRALLSQKSLTAVKEYLYRTIQGGIPANIFAQQ